MVAFVSGGSKGIGFAVARFLASDGCKVAIVAREPLAIERAVTALEGDAIGISADFATEAGVNAAAAEVKSRLAAADICISQTRSRRLGRFFVHRTEASLEPSPRLTMPVSWLARGPSPDMRKTP